MSTTKAWLPNLVGGVSVWKLADDLNAKNFMDGRLLVPETEGAESLPTEVRWNVDGLVPLAQAQRDNPAGVTAAIQDFQTTLAGVEKTLAAEESGYARFRDAFTMPTIDAAGEEQYFFDPATTRLRVKNWGAAPRELAGGKEAVFGLGRLGAVFAGVALPGVAAAGIAAHGAALASAAATVPAAAAPAAEAVAKKPEPDKKASWPWIAAVVLGILVLAIVLLALQDCSKPGDAADAGDASDAGDAGLDAGDAGLDAGRDAGPDAGDAGDAGDDAGGGLDAGTLLLFDDEEPDASLTYVHGGGGGGDIVVVPGGGGGGGAGGKVYVAPGPKGAKGGTHRVHSQPTAKAWRVSTGAERVARAQRKGADFDVWLTPGQTFEGVVVEWRDKDGNWHVH